MSFLLLIAYPETIQIVIFEGDGNLFKGGNVQLVKVNEFMRSGTMQGWTSAMLGGERTYHCHVNDLRDKSV